VQFRLFGDLGDTALSVPEQIAARIGERIILGQLVPGARIAEQELADQFKVSRGPVREAIRILEREGLATVLPRRGALVPQLSARELNELFEMRAGLFDIVVHKVVADRPPELLAVMRAGVDRLEALADMADGGANYTETAYRLILITAQFCGNLRLQRMINALSLQTLRYSKLGLAQVARRQRSARLWRHSQRALERGDLAQLLVLISGGFNVYAREVEEVLAAHPAVADAAVLGLPDAEWGELVAAAVVFHPQAQVGVDDLLAHCALRAATGGIQEAQAGASGRSPATQWRRQGPEGHTAQ
jgi:DNA-binding GntR family transcriptional regulator